MINQLNMENAARFLDFPCRISRIGTVYANAQRQMRITYSETVEICLRLFSAAGYAEDFVDGVRYQTPFPHFVVKKPGMTHVFAVEDSREAFFFCYPASLMPAMQAAGLLPIYPIQKIDMSRQLNQPLRTLIEMMPHSREYGVADRMDVLCYQILSELLLAEKKASFEKDSDRDKIMQISSYLNFHFRGDIDFEALAEKHGFSRRSFFRHWAEHFDRSPARYVLDLKLEEARNLLCDTNCSIGEISSALGFNETNYFCAVFRKYAGMTPNSYRRTHAAVEVRR